MLFFVSSDDADALLSKLHIALSRRFRLSTPTWYSLRWAYDKRLTYQIATSEKVDYPVTFYPGAESDLEAVACTFPAILKPATHASVNRFTADKASRVENRGELLARYREWREVITAELILVQELIPGGCEYQFSYAALFRVGKP